MADVSSSLNAWSATASSNSPSDSTTIGAGLADNLAAIQAVVRGDLASKGTDIPSSAAPDVGAVTGLYHDITGSSTITGLGSTATAGIWKIFQFDDSPVLKHSTALAMVRGGDMTASPGAVGVFFCEASNQWRNVSFFHATAGAAVPYASTTQAGVIEVATNAEALAGTSDTVAVTPSALAAVMGMTILATGQCSATAICDVTMTGVTSFQNKLLVLENFIPATDNVTLQGQVSTDGGANFDGGAASYGYAASHMSQSGSRSDGGGTDNKIQIATGCGNGTGESVNAEIWLYDTETATYPKIRVEATYYDQSPNTIARTVSSTRLAAQNTDAFRVAFGAGNITSGTWILLGFH